VPAAIPASRHRRHCSQLGFGKGAGSQSPPAGNRKNAGAVSLQNYQRFTEDEKSQPGISENTRHIPGNSGEHILNT